VLALSHEKPSTLPPGRAFGEPMTGSSGVSSTLRLLHSIIGVSGILDRPPSGGDGCRCSARLDAVIASASEAIHRAASRKNALLRRANRLNPFNKIGSGFARSWWTAGLENAGYAGHTRRMRIGFSILLAATLLVAAILLVFRGDLHARMGEPVKQCGFWGDMEAGMSCR
jgi:hypothetical protein